MPTIPNGSKMRSGECLNGPLTDLSIVTIVNQLKAKLPVYSGLSLQGIVNDGNVVATASLFSDIAAKDRVHPRSSCPHSSSSPPQSASHGHHGVSAPSTASVSSSDTHRTPPSEASSSSSQRVPVNVPPPRAPGATNALLLSLSEVLDTISKLSAPPVQVLHSQVIILQLLVRVLAARVSGSSVPSVPLAPLDPPTVSYLLSVLLSFLPCRTGDLIGFGTGSGSDGNAIWGEPRHVSISPQHAPALRLTPLPRVALHGFEAFAPPALHADGEGLLCPTYIWEGATETAFLGNQIPKIDGVRLPYPLPYVKLHDLRDSAPPMLCFLPPVRFLARLAARALYFLSLADEVGVNPGPCPGAGWISAGAGDGHVAGTGAQAINFNPVSPTSASRGVEGNDGMGQAPVNGGEQHAQSGGILWGESMTMRGELDCSKAVARRVGWSLARLASLEIGGVADGPAGGELDGAGDGFPSQGSRQHRPRDGDATPPPSAIPQTITGKLHRRATHSFGPTPIALHFPSFTGPTKEPNGGAATTTWASAEWRGEEDVAELRMLGFVAIGRQRLGRIMRESASLLFTMSPPVQAALAASIRMAVFAWLEHEPSEFIRIVGRSVGGGGRAWYGAQGNMSSLSASPARVEGAERLLDALSGLLREYTGVVATGTQGGSKVYGGSGDGGDGPGPKQLASVRALLWTGMGALWCVSPERVRATEAGKSNNLLEQLARFTHAQGPNLDIALRVYADICRAAFFLPPECEYCALKVVARDVAEDLASLLERFPPYNCPYMIDTELYTDALVAIYRHSPTRAQPLFAAWLEPHRPDVVKLCGVRAAMTLVVEAPAFPWQPDLTPLVRSCSIRFNRLLRTMLKDRDEPYSHVQPNRKALRRTLLLSLQGLLRLDTALVLDGPSHVDLADVHRAGAHILEPPRDHGVLMMTFAMYATWIERARRVVRRKEPLHQQALAYLNASILTTLFACAQQIVHVWHNMENVLCVYAMQSILRLLVEPPEDGEDMSWKYVDARFPALAMAQVATITAYKSAQPDISVAAVRAFGIIAQVLNDPAAPPVPAYLIGGTRQSLSTFTDALTYTAEVTTRIPFLSGAAVQKALRRELRGIIFSAGCSHACWAESHWRFTVLTPIVVNPEGLSTPPAGVEIGPATYKDRRVEWTNIVLALSRRTPACLDDFDPLYTQVLGSHLPHRLQIHSKPKQLVEEFVMQLIDLLVSDSLYARETAKQALGAELSFELVPSLFKMLQVIVPERLRDAQMNIPERSTILLVEQCIAVLQLIVDRLNDKKGDDYTKFPKSDVGMVLLATVRFLNRPVAAASDLRTRSQYSVLIQSLTKSRQVFTCHPEIRGRHQVLDIIIGWASTTPATSLSLEEQSAPAFVSALRHCRATAVCTACILTVGMVLEPFKPVYAVDKYDSPSRLFHRYSTAFIQMLDLGKSYDGSIKSESDNALSSNLSMACAQSQLAVLSDAQIYDSVITGIANLVNANTDIGFQQCVAYGYDVDPRMRVVFMESFSRVLKEGTKFHTRGTLKLGQHLSQLCELVRNSEVLVEAMIDVCASADIESLTSALLGIFDTRRAVLGLLQQLISREIRNAGSPADLFRPNNLCNRMLSAFASQYGYWYLRNMISPLVERILELPADMTFELDPNKLRPGDNLELNLNIITELAQFFIDHMIASAPELPSVIVDICHFISTTVFICPAIVSPESIDIDLLPHGPQMHSNHRRGLLIVAKILQNLSNNIIFGREAHMVSLNPLLEANIVHVTRFLKEPFNSPSPDHDIDQWLGMSCDEMDTVALHFFFQRHIDDLDKLLHFESSNESATTQLRPRPVLTELRTLLAKLGPTIDPLEPSLAPTAANFAFQKFMSQNAHRSTESVSGMFYVCEERPDVFVYNPVAVNIETADLQLLTYHVCRLLLDCLPAPNRYILVTDYTGFHPESDTSLTWLRLWYEFMPEDLRRKISIMCALNANASMQRHICKLMDLNPGLSYFDEFYVVSSLSELYERISYVPSLAKSSTGLLEAEPFRAFQNVHQQHVPHARSAVTLEVRQSHLRITSVKKQVILPGLLCKAVDIVPLVEIDDVYRISVNGHLDDFVITRNRRGVALQFSSPSRDTLVQAIRAAKSCAVSPELQAPRFMGLSDGTATLLAIGLMNTCHEQESPRGAAISFLTAICSYLKYDAISAILPAKSTLMVMNPTRAFVLFNERMAASGAHLTLDFLIEFGLGFRKASKNQKAACLSYLPPWIRNLGLSMAPGDVSTEEPSTVSKFRDAIRALCEISFEDLALYPLAKEYVWIELAKTNDVALSLVTDELIRLAVDSSMESRRCEHIADVAMILSSMSVRSRIISRFRQALRKKALGEVTSEPQDAAWSESVVLSRLALAVSRNPCTPANDQFLLPETVHLVTMLVGSGPLPLRMSIYGIAVNLLQSLLQHVSHDDVGVSELRRLVEDALSPSTARLFGLSPTQSGVDYATPMSPSLEHNEITTVEDISTMLLHVIQLGAGSPGLINVWKARWLSLVTATAFQAFPYMQSRAFTVLGVLIRDNLDDEFFYQILNALKDAIRQSPNGNSVTVLSMLRCMRQLIPTLIGETPYLSGVFWLSICLLQTGHLPYYIESMRLMMVTLEKLEAQGAFSIDSVSAVLLQARSHLANEAIGFDANSGFSFIDDMSFSLSLGCLLYSVTQHQALRSTAGDIIRAVLQLISRHVEAGSRPREKTREIDPSIVGFFLVSLPFCATVASLRSLLEDSNVDVLFWESNGMFSGKDHDGYECTVPFPLLGALDTSNSYLIVAFFLSMIELRVGDIPEREILYSAFAEANKFHPDMVAEAQIHYLLFNSSDWLQSRHSYAFSGYATTTILSGMTKAFGSLLMFTDQRALVEDSTSLSTTSGDDTRTSHYRALEDLGMFGLITHIRPASKRANPFGAFSTLLGELVERISGLQPF